MPLTELGFQRLTYAELLEIQIERAKLLFGEDIDTSDNSTFGKILRLYCLDAAENQELAETVYLSAFPNTARGVSLDRLTPLVGISRNPATYAQHRVTITGTAGATVAMGFKVSAGDVMFHIIDNYTIGSNGTVSAVFECDDSGTVGNVAVGDIDTIVNPDANVTGITHTAIEKLAMNTETDYELRKKFVESLSSAGSGTADAIKGAILRVSGVESVLIEENATNSTVGELPPHSFRCFVLAPASTKQAVAEAIFAKKPLGILTYGTENVSVLDASGNAHIISFSWTDEIPIYVRCNISIGSEYGSNMIDTIKANIVNKLEAYSNGQDVTATSLYGEIYVEGVADVTRLEISSDGTTYTTGTIAINNNSVARTAVANIEVTVNE